jgi:hypothetical protein
MIIGICGLIGSGKGTVADILQIENNWTKVSFADSLKDCVSVVFGWPRELLEGNTYESRAWREQVDQWWSEHLDMPHLTPRWILQYWGTEVLRQGFHNDLWIHSVRRKIASVSSNFVIPDTRFPNEIKMIKEVGGEIWLVKRGEDPEWLQKYQSHSIIPDDIHASEWMWAKSEFDHVILNDGTITDLRNTVNSLLNQSK